MHCAAQLAQLKDLNETMRIAVRQLQAKDASVAMR
jgi:hypothetical protein